MRTFSLWRNSAFFAWKGRQVLFLFICLFLSKLLPAQSLEGNISDKDSREPLAYASVGIKNKNKGGIADRNGNFKIDISNVSPSDSIVFSHIGYTSAAFKIGKINPAKRTDIKLRRFKQELAQVTIAAKRKILILGNKKFSNRFTGWGDYSSSKGRARGLVVEPMEYPVKAVEFLCHIKYNTFDSVKVRLNILKKVKEEPYFEQLLADNIYFTIPQNAKWINIDLNPYNIIIKDTIVLALEWIDSWAPAKKPGEESNLFTISLGNSEGDFYERNTPNEVPALSQIHEIPTMYLRAYKIGKAQ